MTDNKITSGRFTNIVNGKVAQCYLVTQDIINEVGDKVTTPSGVITLRPNYHWLVEYEGGEIAVWVDKGFETCFDIIG